MPEALSYLAKASALFEALAAEQPNNVEYRRLIAYTQIYVAQALLAQDDRVGAMETYSKAVASMQTLMSIDPSDSKAPAGLALALTRMATEMKKIGDLAECRKGRQRSHRTHARRSGEARSRTLRVERLRQCAAEIGDRIACGSRPRRWNWPFAPPAPRKESNALFLDTLAWAYFRNGDAPSAIRTERQALSLVPAGNALGQGLRSELEQGLAQFEALP